jgi:cytochrome c peroxidase
VLQLPEGFPEPVYQFTNNPLTEEGIRLGKKLFYESRLAKFNDVSCGSCHQQFAAFTQFDHDLGHGTNHQHTTRNNPAISNMIWHTSMQWDGAVADLPSQVEACITAPEKMGETMNDVAAKLSGDSVYKRLTGEAFGDENITGERIQKTLTQFVATIISANSKYDKVKRGEAQFTASEQSGYEIFKSKCESCHREPLFTDFSFRNTGLEVNPSHPDYGRSGVTGNSTDSLKFKVPSLRNIGYTGYYAHDGRFLDFAQMIDHYSVGGDNNTTVDPLLQSPMNFSNLERFYLQQFLYTLDDSTLVSDSRFAEP